MRRNEFIGKLYAAARWADGQRPRPGAASHTNSRPTHLCARMTAGDLDWWGAVGFALHTMSRHHSPNGPPPIVEVISISRRRLGAIPPLRRHSRSGAVQGVAPRGLSLAPGGCISGSHPLTIQPQKHNLNIDLMASTIHSRSEIQRCTKGKPR